MIARQFWKRRRGSAVLKVAFWTIVTPVAMLSRAMGLDQLRQRSQPDSTSYWQVRDAADQPVVMTDQS